MKLMMVIIVTILHVCLCNCWKALIHWAILLINHFCLWIDCIWWYSFANRASWSILQILHAGKTIKILSRHSSLQSTLVWKSNCPQILRWVSVIKLLSFSRWTYWEGIFNIVEFAVIYTTNYMLGWSKALLLNLFFL